MTEHVITYILLLGIIIALGHLFQKSTIPLSLMLVIFGMVLSFVPWIPTVEIDPELILNVFLPLLIYQISAFSSWRDIRKQILPIASLSIGHVVFITVLVACVIHTLIPQMGWPLAFVLGAIISPPDDVAIVSICEKIRIPERIFNILEGEGMFNDAAALILFRVALAAAITHTFYFMHALSAFLMIIVGETLYGYLIGTLIGKIRLKIKNTILHMIAGMITPFIAYIPVVMLGGTGVLATAIVGFLIGNKYSVRFTPEYRIIGMAIWPALAFAIEGIIFLLVGLDLHNIYLHISLISAEKLVLYVSSIVATVVLGRFIWVFGSTLLFPKIFFPHHDKTKYRNAFLISWAGMRGGISLAAALAIPTLYFQIEGVDLRDLLIFLVLSIIIVTLVIQGLTLPFLLRKFGLDVIGEKEKYDEHLAELHARVQMIGTVLEWLQQYKNEIGHEKKFVEEVDLHLHEYEILLKKYKKRIAAHDKKEQVFHDERREVRASTSLLMQIIKVEKKELLHLWRQEKISLRTRNKLLAVLDHHMQRFSI